MHARIYFGYHSKKNPSIILGIRITRDQLSGLDLAFADQPSATMPKQEWTDVTGLDWEKQDEEKKAIS
ncbi:hypothetical protein TNCV_1601081 [Trichonephila clavipes]|nr:hypothetical protein TNCV_1601081 [Trichonephila clavipes]